MPKDGISYALQSHFEERSLMLIKPTQEISLGTKENPHIIHLTQSLSVKEKEEFIVFFQENKIIFSWKKYDVPSLDPDLNLHHLSIVLGIKLVKQKT